MHESRAVPRTGSGHRRTVVGEFFTGFGGTHVALDATARVCGSPIHIVKLADDALHEREVCEVGSAQSTRPIRHAQAGSIRDTGVRSAELLLNCTLALK